ncbi:MAG: TRAP transporter small permease [Geminicoccaceae bacterium]|nr:MAG: TRAP transporter small permease [Geminicoccaceae bacterium]
MALLRRLNDLLERLLLIVAASLFAVFIGVIFYQVLARNYLRVSAVWTDEVALICFVWSVFLGAAVALRRRVHYEVQLFPPHYVVVNGLLRLGASLAALLFIYVMIRYGWTFTNMGMRRTSTATGLPLAYVFAALPTSGVAMAIFSLETIRDDVLALLERRATAEAQDLDRP